ncbi:zinc finger protein 771-like [Cottoperca gobio]|uniref:Zinc finger protein 771-like n=1 Tax=Cottoperca gobio TaxID=56716 RepID=A0A6J2PGP7_COTGO|nr:zinc finger protein 771-like [Cottoperca gobio]XP_029284529.1 zinc finger protein 771-like [Cottoperca gobio]
MFKKEKLKALVNERLKAAAEEIFSMFETTLKDYEEIVFRSKQEIDQHRRRLAARKAPLQPSVQEEDAPSEQDHCERKTDPSEDDQEPPQIKEELEDEVWTAQAGEKQQKEADTKDSMFNIVYVQRNDEDGRQDPHHDQEVENKGDCLPSGSSCGQFQSEPDKEDGDASSSDADMSEVSDDEWRDAGGVYSGVNRKQPQHETAERPYTCSICNKNFRIKSILTRHMKTHTGEKPYRCGVCGKSFIQRSYLQTHMNSHSGQKPHTCSFCGRGFTQVGNMNAHIRIHTGEKPHSCTDCGKSFREKADLIKHTIIHTGEKPYICTVCHMKFSAQSNLTRHMKTHSGERPYSCTDCGKRFIRRSHLIIHMKTHAGDNL